MDLKEIEDFMEYYYNADDVLCGRHPEAYNHPTTKWARSIVKEYLDEYIELRSDNRRREIGNLFELILKRIEQECRKRRRLSSSLALVVPHQDQEQPRKRRFLKRSKKDNNLWVVMEEEDRKKSVRHWLHGEFKKQPKRKQQDERNESFQTRVAATFKSTRTAAQTNMEEDQTAPTSLFVEESLVGLQSPPTRKPSVSSSAIREDQTIVAASTAKNQEHHTHDITTTPKQNYHGSESSPTTLRVISVEHDKKSFVLFDDEVTNVPLLPSLLDVDIASPSSFMINQEDPSSSSSSSESTKRSSEEDQELQNSVQEVEDPNQKKCSCSCHRKKTEHHKEERSFWRSLSPINGNHSNDNTAKNDDDDDSSSCETTNNNTSTQQSDEDACLFSSSTRQDDDDWSHDDHRFHPVSDNHLTNMDVLALERLLILEDKGLTTGNDG